MRLTASKPWLMSSSSARFFWEVFRRNRRVFTKRFLVRKRTKPFWLVDWRPPIRFIDSHNFSLTFWIKFWINLNFRKPFTSRPLDINSLDGPRKFDIRLTGCAALFGILFKFFSQNFKFIWNRLIKAKFNCVLLKSLRQWLSCCLERWKVFKSQICCSRNRLKTERFYFEDLKTDCSIGWFWKFRLHQFGRPSSSAPGQSSY